MITGFIFGIIAGIALSFCFQLWLGSLCDERNGLPVPRGGCGND